MVDGIQSQGGSSVNQLSEQQLDAMAGELPPPPGSIGSRTRYESKQAKSEAEKMPENVYAARPNLKPPLGESEMQALTTKNQKKEDKDGVKDSDGNRSETAGTGATAKTETTVEAGATVKAGATTETEITTGTTAAGSTENTSPLDEVFVIKPGSAVAKILDGQKQILGDMKTVLDKYQSNIEQMPDGPSKNVYINYLKTISAALDLAQQQLSEIVTAHTAGSKVLSTAKFQEKQDQIDVHMKAIQEQKEQQEEIDKGKKKAGTMKIVMMIVTPIVIALSVVAMIVTFGAATPMMLALDAMMIGMMVTAMAGGPDVMALAFDKLGEGIGFLFDSAINKVLDKIGIHGDGPKKFFTIYAKVCLIVAMVAMGNAGGGGASATALGVQAFASSNVAGEAVVDCGATGKTAMILTMCINCAVIIMAMLAGGGGKEPVPKAQQLAKLDGEIASINEQLVVVNAGIESAKDAGDTLTLVQLNLQKAALEVKVSIKQGCRDFISNFARDTDKPGKMAGKLNEGMAKNDMKIKENLQTIKNNEAELAAAQNGIGSSGRTVEDIQMQTKLLKGDNFGLACRNMVSNMAYTILTDPEYVTAMMRMGLNDCVAGCQFANGIFQQNIDNALGEKAMISAREKKDAELLEMQIDMLEGTIKQLLKLLESLSSGMGEIGNLMTKVTDDFRVQQSPT